MQLHSPPSPTSVRFRNARNGFARIRGGNRLDLVAYSCACAEEPLGVEDDQTGNYMIEMERKWAQGVCVDNGVVAGLLADDFQGTSPSGVRFTKADELEVEKAARTARGCGLDEAKVRFFGDSLAVVYGMEHAVGKDKSQPNEKVCQVWTDTWLKRRDTWQIIASHDNRVKCR